ncbi:hypothetical protein [Nocardioides cynanchi]|uniref:hypothetical protein n=1 Tax=Nocardioides cynanchi TaxID=2558918 RepID=UPI00124882D9|nr:hypothetical protein [Nocardioides cynanchi]
MPFLYHLCADDFRGDELLPLNLLASRFPDLHDREVRKWAGRESVVSFPVPHLGVAWGDTVNLAALDPARLVEARRRLGLPFSSLLQRKVLRIPLERIAGQPAVVYDTRSHWRNSRPDAEDVPEVPPSSDFTPFDPDSYEELTEVPPLHLDYLVEQRDAGLPALGFVFVRHVLVAGAVDVAGLARTRLA